MLSNSILRTNIQPSAYSHILSPGKHVENKLRCSFIVFRLLSLKFILIHSLWFQIPFACIGYAAKKFQSQFFYCLNMRPTRLHWRGYWGWLSQRTDISSGQSILKGSIAEIFCQVLGYLMFLWHCIQGQICRNLHLQTFRNKAFIENPVGHQASENSPFWNLALKVPPCN